jgi:hypothetical protein
VVELLPGIDVALGSTFSTTKEKKIWIKSTGKENTTIYNWNF